MTKLNRRDFIAGSTMLAIGASGVTTATAPGEHCTLIMMHDPIEKQKAAFAALPLPHAEDLIIVFSHLIEPVRWVGAVHLMRNFRYAYE
jgi:hypothetical protein